MPLRVREEVQALPRSAGLKMFRLADVAREALASPILILGAQRSGTTWLAKIVDSHPDVIYRHEPDEAVPAPAGLSAEDLPALLVRWIETRTVREVGVRPLFPKSWQPVWARALQVSCVTAARAAGRLPAPARSLSAVSIPECSSCPASRLAVKSIRWAEGAAVLARTLPASRTIFILRHPCGQVASVMRGNRQRRFDLRTAGTDMPYDETGAARFAATQGMDEPAFQALPDAAKYAWDWRAFNESTYDALGSSGNVHIVLYEALCAGPKGRAERIMQFASLDWNLQTAAFVASSTTHQGEAGYYAIYRNAIAAAENWRKTMPLDDQAIVRSVVSASPLARFWPDLSK